MNGPNFLALNWKPFCSITSIIRLSPILSVPLHFLAQNLFSCCRCNGRCKTYILSFSWKFLRKLENCFFYFVIHSYIILLSVNEAFMAIPQQLRLNSIHALCIVAVLRKVFLGRGGTKPESFMIIFAIFSQLGRLQLVYCSPLVILSRVVFSLTNISSGIFSEEPFSELYSVNLGELLKDWGVWTH